MRLNLRSFAMLAWLALFSGAAPTLYLHAEDPAPGTSSATEKVTEKSVEKPEKTEPLEEARKKIVDLRGSVTIAEKTQPVEFGKRPILMFSDPIRKENNGTVWVIGTENRPRAIVSLFFVASDNFWSYEFTSMSSDLLTVEKPMKWAWKTKQSGLSIQDLKNEAIPVASSVGRLAQIKAIAREFSASEFFGDGSRTELRLLPQPLHRYSDESQGIIDGALFAFAHGTNPELLLVIESFRSADQKTGWRCGAARMSSARLQLSRDGAEVWKIEESQRDSASDSYYSYREKPRPVLPSE